MQYGKAVAGASKSCSKGFLPLDRERSAAIEKLEMAMAAYPVTFYQFAEFLKTDAYFKAAYWPYTVYRELSRGDEILKRIGFRWGTNQLPVSNVTWHEAAAYCEWRGGRLPWYQELKSLRGSRKVGNHGFAGKLLGWRGPEKNRQSSGLFEWCGDWYHPCAYGPDVNPERPPRKRVWDSPFQSMAPTANHPRVGFRICGSHSQYMADFS